MDGQPSPPHLCAQSKCPGSLQRLWAQRGEDWLIQACSVAFQQLWHRVAQQCKRRNSMGASGSDALPHLCANLESAATASDAAAVTATAGEQRHTRALARHGGACTAS
eukprot:366426-Chlamydomonas_euryale.AAC.4